jgi:YidC/Oxa1 family membrane protein insertase
MSYIINAVISIMNGINGVTNSWGLTIIVMTVLVRLVILPFTIMQVRSTRAMAALQPEMQKLQKKYKDDPERLNMEIMELYKSHNVNPASSCLVFAVQLPVLMAMIGALGKHPALAEASFLGFQLSEPGPKLLILIAISTTYLAVKLSPSMGADQQQGGSQNMMIIGMMALMWFFASRYSAAVSIYIIAANLTGVLERLVIPRSETSTKGAGTK